MIILPSVTFATDYRINSDTNLFTKNLVAGDTITVQSGFNLKIYSSNTTTIYNINIICEDNVNLTIENVNISASSGCALDFQGGTNTLTLLANNTFRSSNSYPGINVTGTTSLEILGTGKITANGGSHSSGLGGGENTSAGTITIRDGIIISTGGQYGSGIGGGEQGTGGTINIYGGNITARSGTNSAGIGGGAVGAGGTINIYGGVITTYGNTNGAGIGGGSLKSGGDITISGGTITARSGSYGAGIGGGSQGSGGNITITEGTVTAYSTYRAAAIGSGYYSDCGNILITGGNINAIYISSGYGAAIGTGQYGRGGNIQIDGGTIYCLGGRYGGAGIGGGANSAVINIQINGGTIEAKGQRAAGIGGGRYSAGGTIEITGGLVLTDTSYSGYNDIGDASTGVGIIDISGDAALFLKNSRASTVSTSTHLYFFDETIASSSAYGYNLPSFWSGTAYAWIPAHTVTYTTDPNGSLVSGYPTSEIVINGYSPTNAPDTIPNSSYVFDGWSNGVITSTDLSSFIITAPTTLTAVFSLIAVTDVDIDISSATLVLGDISTTNDTINLTETIIPANASNQTVTWSSSDTSIATVDSNGLVTAIKAGVANISVTAQDSGHTDSSTITVEQRVTSVSLDTNAITCDIGATNTIVCTVGPIDAIDKSVTWVIDNPLVASITVIDSVTCLISATDVGIARISVITTDGGFRDVCTLIATYPTEREEGFRSSLTGKLIDANGNSLEGYIFTLYSTPITELTSAEGTFAYPDIAYTHHTLVIQNPSNIEIERFSLMFREGRITGYSHNGSTVSITYTPSTLNIDLLFQLNATLDGVDFIKISFLNNPETGDTLTFIERIVRFFKNIFSNLFY